VSSNGFDVAGARSFGFNVARIERIDPATLRGELFVGDAIGPATMYRALRMQNEALGWPAHAVVDSLLALPGLAETLQS
jgi:2-haloacid dehalogenase